jgi:murein DD-endopeptidase MepM/ murein hydrolase activator NlpD
MKTFFSGEHDVDTGGWLRAVAGFCLIAMVAGGAAGAGYWYGQQRALAAVPEAGAADALREALGREREELATAQEEARSILDAFGARLGQLQAEVLRLNALGERLVQMADLSAEEFDFENPPPLGGPAEPLDPGPSTPAELTEEMNRLFSELRDRDRKLALIEQLIMERDLSVQILPSGSPVRTGYITSRFGNRKDPISGRTSFHRGVDFAGKTGSDVLAVADGLVTMSGSQSGYGRTVELRHGNGLVTRYAHNQKLLVEVGDFVKQGQVIATLGSSGRSTGPHLHFEVLKDGKHVNPMQYVRLKKEPDQG